MRMGGGEQREAQSYATRFEQHRNNQLLALGYTQEQIDAMDQDEKEQILHGGRFTPAVNPIVPVLPPYNYLKIL